MMTLNGKELTRQELYDNLVSFGQIKRYDTFNERNKREFKDYKTFPEIYRTRSGYYKAVI